ncbi:MAG: metal-dependent hydrolase [Zoogloeaceae bacterium]|jgi:inner membrane protein|nr:metal-dependent hydrolase [Zoogloeaceae bacterium]
MRSLLFQHPMLKKQQPSPNRGQAKMARRGNFPGSSKARAARQSSPRHCHGATRLAMMKFPPLWIAAPSCTLTSAQDFRDKISAVEFISFEHMFIAYAPSGYILAKKLFRTGWPVSLRGALVISVIGALAPDFDLLYFYLVDQRQTHHHRYFSHWPVLWFGLILLFYAIRRLCGNEKLRAWAFGGVLFSAAGFLHLILDSMAGDIWWFAPFVDKPYALFTVPARFSPWWLNFFLHPSFLAEIAIWIWAIRIYRRKD